jgi:hypothetical protein
MVDRAGRVRHRIPTRQRISSAGATTMPPGAADVTGGPGFRSSAHFGAVLSGSGSPMRSQCGPQNFEFGSGKAPVLIHDRISQEMAQAAVAALLEAGAQAEVRQQPRRSPGPAA